MLKRSWSPVVRFLPELPRRGGLQLLGVHLAQSLDLKPLASEVESIVRLVQSRVDMSLERLLVPEASG
jgi:hypothetical protein